MDPMGRAAFQLLDDLARGGGRGRTGEHVDVIVDAADLHGGDAVFSGDAADIGPDAVLDAAVDEFYAVFGAENDVEIDVGIGVCHIFNRR